MKKIVVSTGAGISAESGISTFRDSNGLWENYPVMDVASHTGFLRNPSLVHQFYNERRRDLMKAEPNAAHLALADLQKDFDVRVITQNVDNLHERAGSKNVLHLHGELMKVRSLAREDRVYDISEVSDNLCTTTATRDRYGDPVRPHIVFFEEDVPNFGPAIELVQEADVFVIIGTSLVVYPAAALLNYARPGVPIYYIDPRPAATHRSDVTVIAEPATAGVQKLVDILRSEK